MVPVFRTLGRVISVRRLEEAVQAIEVVDDAPAAAALLDLGAPSFVSSMNFSTRPANARFCRFVVLGRSSNVALATMFFSVKLAVSIRATANESKGCSRDRAKRMICCALTTCLAYEP